MDCAHSTTLPTLIDLLKDQPDPRCRRGRRYEWWQLLTIIAAAMLAGNNHTRAIAQWAADHADLLRARLSLHRGRIPSESTLQRTLRILDLLDLQAVIGQLQGTEAEALVLEGVALDGKTPRGAAKASGTPLHLLQLARHRDGALVRVTPVGRKENEFTAAPAILANYPLRNRVITGDAMFCQRALCQFINDRNGHWLFAVKENQPNLLEAIGDHFAAARGDRHPLDIRTHRDLGKAHGRVERRCLEVSADLVDQLDWPGLAQIIHRTTIRYIDGHESQEHSYWITSLKPQQATPSDLERLCRYHWTIENPVNWVRDVTFGEDRCTTRSQNAPIALAILRSLTRWLVTTCGHFRYAPDGRRHYAHYPADALQLLARRL